MKLMTGRKDRGNKANKILDPSSGGTGTKLNKPRAMLVMTMTEVIKYKLSDMLKLRPMAGIKRIIIPNTKAIKKLAMTPEAAMATVPHFTSRKLFGL